MDKQKRVFHAMSNAVLILVKPGCYVKQKTIYGLAGEPSDLALSLKWRDAEGYEWEADFTEQCLEKATMRRNRIRLNDSDGDSVCLELYELTPAEF